MESTLKVSKGKNRKQMSKEKEKIGSKQQEIPTLTLIDLQYVEAQYCCLIQACKHDNLWSRPQKTIVCNCRHYTQNFQNIL